MQVMQAGIARIVQPLAADPTGREQAKTAGREIPDEFVAVFRRQWIRSSEGPGVGPRQATACSCSRRSRAGGAPSLSWLIRRQSRHLKSTVPMARSPSQFSSGDRLTPFPCKAQNTVSKMPWSRRMPNVTASLHAEKAVPRSKTTLSSYRAFRQLARRNAGSCAISEQR